MTFRKIAILLYCCIAGNKKNNLTIQQYNNCKPQEGFTLIELMIVLSVTAVLGTLGIAGFAVYNQVQTLQTAANDLANTLNVAKSRALSQVKLGSSCSSPSQILEGYNVDISIASKNYTLSSRCSGATSNLYTKILPQNVSFSPDTSRTSFFFPVLTGGAQAAGQIVITGYGRSKIVTVNSLAGVSIVMPPTPTPTPTPTAITIPLDNRFNFISLPVTPPDTSIATVVADIADKVEKIDYYDGAANPPGYLFYIPDQFGNDTLLTLEPGKGYLFGMKTVNNVVQTANLEITGIPYGFQPINLIATRWYMIGAPYTDVKLSDVIGTCNLINIQLSTINGATGANVPITVDSNTLLSSGKGYWIRSSAACILSL